MSISSLISEIGKLRQEQASISSRLARLEASGATGYPQPSPSPEVVQLQDEVAKISDAVALLMPDDDDDHEGVGALLQSMLACPLHNPALSRRIRKVVNRDGAEVGQVVLMDPNDISVSYSLTTVQLETLKRLTVSVRASFIIEDGNNGLTVGLCEGFGCQANIETFDSCSGNIAGSITFGIPYEINMLPSPPSGCVMKFECCWPRGTSFARWHMTARVCFAYNAQTATPYLCSRDGRPVDHPIVVEGDVLYVANLGRMHTHVFRQLDSSAHLVQSKVMIVGGRRALVFPRSGVYSVCFSHSELPESVVPESGIMVTVKSVSGPNERKPSIVEIAKDFGLRVAAKSETSDVSESVPQEHKE